MRRGAGLYRGQDKEGKVTAMDRHTDRMLEGERAGQRASQGRHTRDVQVLGMALCLAMVAP